MYSTKEDKSIVYIVHTIKSVMLERECVCVCVCVHACVCVYMYVCKDRNRCKNKACIEVCVCACTSMYARIETGVRIKPVSKIHNSILCYTQHTFIAPDNSPSHSDSDSDCTSQPSSGPAPNTISKSVNNKEMHIIVAFYYRMVKPSTPRYRQPLYGTGRS